MPGTWRKSLLRCMRAWHWPALKWYIRLYSKGGSEEQTTGVMCICTCWKLTFLHGLTTCCHLPDTHTHISVTSCGSHWMPRFADKGGQISGLPVHPSSTIRCIYANDKVHGAEHFMKSEHFQHFPRQSRNSLWLLWNSKVDYRVHSSPPLYPKSQESSP
jgi:hypothetical protein